MGDQSAIGWTDATWNPWSGCTKVSPGCAHCYAERLFTRWGKDFAVVRRASERTMRAPLHWKKPRMVFTCSMSDFFHETADPWRGDAWDVIRQTPQHTYQILTKRPERIAAHLPHDWGRGWPHVWLGTSVENQRWTPRILTLMNVTAAVRFVSAEPLLGRLDLTCVEVKSAEPATAVVRPVDPIQWYDVLNGSAVTKLGVEYGGYKYLDWVIVGGESGQERRPCDVEWITDVVAQCDFAGVPVFVKQDAHAWPGQQGRIPDDVWRFKQFPAAAAEASA